MKTMDITEDVKRLSDIQRMIGQIGGKSDEDWIDDFCAMIADYIVELFIAKQGYTCLTMPYNKVTYDTKESDTE